MSSDVTGSAASRPKRLRVWFWPWGVTVKRGGRGFCVGVQWPLYQRCSWWAD